MTELFIENNQDRVEISRELEDTLKRVCQKTLEYEKCDFDAQISITRVDDEEIKRLNKEFREKDMPTDVLSFPILEFDSERNIVDAEYDTDGDRIVLGDIVISAERAKEQAESFGHSFLREMSFLTVHSMLHLLGYDHVDDPEGERQMCTKQEEILSLLNINREGI